MYGHDAENLVHPYIQSTTILCDSQCEIKGSSVPRSPMWHVALHWLLVKVLCKLAQAYWEQNGR